MQRLTRLGTSQMKSFASPLMSFDYPSQRGKNEQNTERMRTAEANLDALWKHVDETRLEGTTHTNLLHGLMRNRTSSSTLERTPPWQAPFAVPRPRTTPQSQPNPNFKEPSTNEVDQDKPQEAGLTTRNKPKTRGEADPKKIECPAAEPEEIQETPARLRTIKLAPRAMKVARALYPSNIQDHTPGKVRWQDLLHLMFELNFLIRKHDGSEWYFEPIWMPDVPITIHEPHPTNEIPLVHLRRHARRLRDRYRWTNATFLPL